MMSSTAGLWARTRAAGTAAALAASLVLQPFVGVSPAAATPAPCSNEATNLGTARAMAARCGTAVEVLSERTEYTDVTIASSGVATLVSAIAPQRVHRRDGGWVAVDPSLRVDPTDGSLAPVASTADVRFSGGGSTPFATWRESGSTFTLAWPYGPLPRPTVNGDTATYPSVLADVDLAVTATADGFRFVLVVKTPAAAANPTIREIHYVLGGDASVRSEADGELTVRAPSGRAIATSPGAAMWNSAVDAAVAQQVAPRQLSAAAVSPPAQPGATLPASLVSNVHRAGSTAATSAVELAIAGRDLVVTPDAGALSPTSAYPIFIDPPFNKVASKWTYADSSNANNDTTNARVGLDPTDGRRYRSYFQFDTSAIRGATVLSAKVQMELDHSWACDATWVHLYRTGAFVVASGVRIAWSGTGSLPLGTSGVWLDSWEGNAHEGSPCDQPNATVVFDGSGVLADVKTMAAQSSTYTVGLCACNDAGDLETSQERWKRFETNKSYLIATYDLPPLVPVAQAFTSTNDCYQRCASPAIVRSTQPTLRMAAQDPFGGSLLTAIEIRTAAADTAPIVVDNSTFRFTVSTTAVTTKGSSPAVVGQIQVPAGKLADGATYYWRGTTRDENNLWSGWGAWSSFTVDTSAPAVSSIISSQYPADVWGAVVGTAGTFALTGPPEVADFSWSVDSGAATTVAATGTTTRTASITYTPATDLVHTLHVNARNLAGGSGGTTDMRFWVSPGTARFSYWAMNETSGTTAADSGTGGTASPGLLAGPVTFGPGYLGNAASFTGAGSQITTTGPVLDTTKSFTVMAWVRPASLSAASSQTVLSQDGATISRFELQFQQSANAGAGGWCLAMAAEGAGGPRRSVCADGAVSGLPTNGQWVHIAGRYDASTGLMRIYVMGGTESCSGEMKEETALLPASATGAFAIGRGLASGAATNFWRGAIDEARAYQRVLSDAEICQQALQ